MTRISSVDILGGGPAGLYTAILIRRKLPHLRLRVFEQNPKGATFGFGVVFSDQALEFLAADDPETHDMITPHMERWRNMTLNHPEGQVTLDGVGFTAIGRLELIEILRERAEALGVEVDFETQIEDVSRLDADLVIGADGLNSLVRETLKDDFQPKIWSRVRKFEIFLESPNKIGFLNLETIMEDEAKRERKSVDTRTRKYIPKFKLIQ